MAQATLILPLASAATSARSPFLRCESYRLLSVLFNPKLNPQSSELDKVALKKTTDSAAEVVASICEGLKDGDMQKAKRVRDILKTAEKVLEFAKACRVPLSNVDDLSAAISEANEKVDNQGVKNAIEKIKPMFDALKEDSLEVENDEGDEERDTTADRGTSGKSKKKKKKKKRGKK